MKAIFCKGFNAHYNNAILNVAINLKLNSADLHLTKWGGGGGKPYQVIGLELSPRTYEQKQRKMREQAFEPKFTNFKQGRWKMSKASLDEFFATHSKPSLSYKDDIYFDKDYAKLYGEAFEFEFLQNGHEFKCIGIKSPIANTEFFDLQSPYGYSGFYCDTNDKKFINQALKELKKKALSEQIIAFFLRFHPFDENLSFYKEHFDFFADDRQIILVRTNRALSEIRGDYSPRIKSYVKKARNELEISLCKPSEAPEFKALYEKTMQRNNADKFYFFDENYFKKLFEFDGSIVLKASFNGQVLAYANFFLGRDFGYYHLSANLNEKNANAALLDYFFELCQKRGISFALLGGGLSNDDNLFYYKQRFSTLYAEFNIGGLIFDKLTYGKLCKGVNSKQFLAYRFAETGGGGGGGGGGGDSARWISLPNSKLPNTNNSV